MTTANMAGIGDILKWLPVEALEASGTAVNLSSPVRTRACRGARDDWKPALSCRSVNVTIRPNPESKLRHFPSVDRLRGDGLASPKRLL